MVTQAVPNSAVNFNALPHGMTATADAVVPPPTALPPPMFTATVPQTFTQSIHTFIVKQPQLLKPYSGATSWRSFREQFERICRVNSWTSTADKVQNLTLALEGPAAEILKDINEASPTAYDEIWTLLARRFGQTDAPRDSTECDFRIRGKFVHYSLGTWPLNFGNHTQGTQGAIRFKVSKTPCAVSITAVSLMARLYPNTNRPSVCFIEKPGRLLPQVRETLI